MVKTLFYDLETTGRIPYVHAIHEIGGCIDIDGEIVEKFTINMKPHPGARISKEALDVSGKTEEDINGYQNADKGAEELKRLLEKYVDPFNAKDRLYISGFNNLGFDDLFLSVFFSRFGLRWSSYFWAGGSLDVMALSAQYLKGIRRSKMPSFRLTRVAKTLGLEVDDDSAHNALHDAMLTRDIYRVCTGLEFEEIL